MAKKPKTKKVIKSPPAKVVKSKPAASKATKPKSAGGGKRISWVDTRTQTPLIESYAKQLDSFIRTMADGEVDESEIKNQEKHLVDLMKQIEPLLDDRQHARITELLCELTAYDIMQMLFTINASRPTTKFRG